jgi:hypothetical protein
MEREIILKCIQENLFHLLDKEACEMTIGELLQEKVITIYKGNFYITGKEGDLTLDSFVDEFCMLFSHKRIGVTGKGGAKSIVKPKAKRFKLETGITYEEMIVLAKKHIEDTPPMFITSAKYFFYKDKGKNAQSKAKDILDEMMLELNDQNMFDTNE